MARPFNSELILDERISEISLKAFHVGFDQEKFRLLPLVETIRSVIPEYALGYHEGKNIPLTEMVDRLQDAAKTVYTTDKYKQRGEFGELILHLLLRDFCNSIPLISTIYFRDSPNVPAHGFDGVHITINGDEKKLWLGESKLYKSGTQGVSNLVEDIAKHFNANYLQQQFSLITRKLPSDVPEIEYWRTLMHKKQKLDTVFSSIVIPMVCTYNSDLFINHNNESQQYIDDFQKECLALHDEFNKKIPTSNLEIILLLLPVPDKDELNTELDIRLKAMQKI
jgi:Cap4 SAVED domain